MASDPLSVLVETLNPLNVLSLLMGGAEVPGSGFPTDPQVPVIPTADSRGVAIAPPDPVKEDVIDARVTNVTKNYEPYHRVTRRGESVYVESDVSEEPSFTSFYSRHPNASRRFNQGYSGPEFTQKQRDATRGLNNAWVKRGSKTSVSYRRGRQHTNRGWVEPQEDNPFTTAGIQSVRRRKGMAARHRGYPFRLGTNIF